MRAQHGLLHRRQARELGLTDAAIARRVRKGEWLRHDVSVFRHATHTMTWETKLLGVCLSFDGVASHRSAAALWELDDFRRTRVEVTVSHSRRFERPGILVHHLRQTGDLAARTIDAIPCTGIARTLLDLGAVVSFRRLEDAVDSAIRQRLVAWDDLVVVLARHSRKGRDGCGPLRALLEERYGDSNVPDSGWNRRVGRLLVQSGLPRPSFEYWIKAPDGQRNRLDLVYPEQRVVVELDSVRWHLNRRSFEGDRRKWNRLINAGWTVLTFSHADYRDQPNQLVNTVAAALRRASVEGSAR